MDISNKQSIKVAHFMPNFSTIFTSHVTLINCMNITVKLMEIESDIKILLYTMLIISHGAKCLLLADAMYRLP